MAFIELIDGMLVGEEGIDSQHKELIYKINMLHELIEAKAPKAEIEAIFAFLEHYVADHFGYEEELMEKYNYPETERHKAKHKHFVDEFLKARDGFRAHTGDQLWPGMSGLESLLKNWLVTHIMTIDKKLGQFLGLRV